MTVSRRDFLKGAAGTGAALAAAGTGTGAAARDNLPMPPQAVGLLFDATLCVGCKACVTACKLANDIPLEVPPDQPYLDPSVELGPKVLNVIKMYRHGTAEVKDRETDGFAFVKNSCMHCVDPSCVSVCPVSAMQKDPVSGIVTYSKDACIGCRYCVASCPFRIPKSDYDTPFPEIHKCQLCRHLHAEGKFSACADACPTGATLYGPVDKLAAEAKRRLALPPGEVTKVPRRSTETGETARARPIAHYVDHLYGATEGGGTQVLMLSGVPFDKLSKPALPERSYAAVSETIQHTLYQGLIAPAAVLGGLLFLTYRNARHDGPADGPEHDQDREQEKVEGEPS